VSGADVFEDEEISSVEEKDIKGSFFVNFRSQIQAKSERTSL
jgi:hypothetical protein